MATNGPSSINVSFYSWIKTSRTNSNGQKDLIDCKRCRIQQTANYFFRTVRIPKWISFTVRLIVIFPPCWLRKLTWCQAFNWYLVACIVICKMFRDMFACLTWYVQTGNLVTTSFHGKTQKLLSQFKEGPIPLNGVFMDVPDLRSIGNTEVLKAARNKLFARNEKQIDNYTLIPSLIHVSCVYQPSWRFPKNILRYGCCSLLIFVAKKATKGTELQL